VINIQNRPKNSTFLSLSVGPTNDRLW